MTKTILAIAAAGMVYFPALAAPEQNTMYGDTARVVSSTPIHDKSPYSRRECRLEQTGYSTAANEIERCDDIADARERVVGYDVTYEYNGRQFRVRLPYEPGDRIAVNIEVRPPLPEDGRSPRIPRYRGPY